MSARLNRIRAYAPERVLTASLHLTTQPGTTQGATPQPANDVSIIDDEAIRLSAMRNPVEPQSTEPNAAPEASASSAVSESGGDSSTSESSSVASPSAELPEASNEAAASSDIKLSAAVRILPAHRERDRTFLIALGLVLLAHVGFVAGTLYQPAGSPDDATQEQERRGQVDVSETITVELVEDPDGASKSKQSQIGVDAPPGEQSPLQPTPPTPPSEAEKAEQQPPEDPKPQNTEKPVEQAKPSAQPKRAPPPPDAAPELSLEDFDTTMDEYAAAVDRAQAEARRRADPRTAEAQRIKGAAAQGKQSAYSKSVTTALARNKPKGYLTRGAVYVQFELTMTGALRYVRVVQSSGDPLLDQSGVDAVKKTPFPAPPPDVDPRDLRYTIHYVFN